MTTTLHDRTDRRPRPGRRAALAGVLGALALAAGAGAASAADAPTAPETGYAVVVDETTPTTTGGLCPDRTGSTDGAL